MKKKEDTVLRKDQISSYFERIQPKKDGSSGDDQKKIGFSVGCSTSTATDARGSHRIASTEKTALFSSYLIPTSSDNNDAATAPSTTLEKGKASCAARCLAILGVASSATTKSLPTKEEIIKSRKLREQEIMRKSDEIIRIQEENRKRRPLIWDKPTFCPYGGETKSDDDEAEEKSKKKRKVTDPCSNLLSKTSKRNRHDTLFPYNMFGRMSGQSSTSNVGMDWNKAQVDSFVSFTDQMIAAAGEKKREQDGTTVSDFSSEEEEGEFRRR